MAGLHPKESLRPGHLETRLQASKGMEVIAPGKKNRASAVATTQSKGTRAHKVKICQDAQLEVGYGTLPKLQSLSDMLFRLLKLSLFH